MAQLTASDLNSIAMVRQVIQHREQMRNHLSEFVVRSFATVDPGTTYKHNWHIDCVSEHAEAVILGQIPKLIVNMPPRMMKSINLSVALPAWLLGKNPSYRIIAASGVQKLATRFNDHTRLIMRSDWYKTLFPETRLRPGQDEKMRFETTSGGHRISASVGSSVIGEGGRLGIIDDPIDPKKAVSVAELEKANDWYDQEWSTRFDDPELTLQILVMQRLHRGDLTQHVLDLGGWYHLKLPQEAPTRVVVKFPLSGREVIRKKDELLHIDRFGHTARAEARKTLGEYGYSAQQQQEPVAKGGNRIKMYWFGKYGAFKETWDETVLSFDTASKGKDINNPSVCEVFRRKGPQWYLVHVMRENLIYPELKRRLLLLEAEYQPNAILIEDKSSGTQLLQEAPGEGMNIHSCVAIEPHGDKVTRMELEMPALEGGIIALPDPAIIKVPWMNDFESELMEFPMCLTFDQIDALSQFLMWRRTNKVKVELW